MESLLETTQVITSKKAQYTRLIDTHQLPLLNAILLPGFSFKMLDHEGAILNLGGNAVIYHTLAEFQAHFSELLKTKQSIHLVGPPELEQVGSDEIKAVFAMHALSADVGVQPKGRMTMAGHYHDVWKRVDGKWWLAEVALRLSYCTVDE